MGNWQLDPYHTQVEVSAKHLGMMTVRGHFAEVSAAADIDLDYPGASSVEVTFKSTSVEPAGEDLYALTGDLTIKGDTRPVALKVLKYGEFNDPTMGHRIAYSAQGQINRKEFGLSFNMMLDGKFVVSDEIQIMIEGELVEQKEAAKAASA